MQKNNYIIRYVPNLVTLLCLASGFTSIRFSLNGEWKIAIYLILLASVFDFFANNHQHYSEKADSAKNTVFFYLTLYVCFFYFKIYEILSYALGSATLTFSTEI